MTSKLVFEKVGDINSKYSYLCVYLEGNTEPFMEIAVTEERKLEFTFYPSENKTSLDIDQVKEILNKAHLFLPKALTDEDFS